MMQTELNDVCSGDLIMEIISIFNISAFRVVQDKHFGGSLTFL